MGLIDVGAIVVAIVAALGAWLAQRSAARAGAINTERSGRLDAEKGAYERARNFDISTIERQDAEILELQATNAELLAELIRTNQKLHAISRFYPDWERLLNERTDEGDDQERRGL